MVFCLAHRRHQSKPRSSREVKFHRRVAIRPAQMLLGVGVQQLAQQDIFSRSLLKMSV